MCHPRRDEQIPRPKFIEPLTDESDTDDEEMTETDIESEEEIENAEDTSIEESDENDDEIEDIDVTSGEEFSSEEDTIRRRLARLRRIQSSIENELVSLSGVTFNGFNHNLVPDEITGHRVLSLDQIFLRVRWRGYPGTHEIELSVMRDHTPDMILDYLRAVYTRYSESNFPLVGIF